MASANITKRTFWACKKNSPFAIETNKGLGKRPSPRNALVFSMAYLVTFIDDVVQLWKNVLFTYWEVENNLSCNMPTRMLTYSYGIMYENTKIRLILSIPVQKIWYYDRQTGIIGVSVNFKQPIITGGNKCVFQV